jgi:predicted homoserine dehydrogenase-like protein
MNYQKRYAHVQKPVETCVVGSGGFGRSFLAQGLRVPLLNARIAVDTSTDIALEALTSIGIDAVNIAVCTTKAEALAAWNQGKYLACADLQIVLSLPFDLVAEATGHPEAGAKHCRLAIEAGKHVALASKEVDSVIGPELARQAQLKGNIVTPVDGDQPALLIGLITWAQTLGFEILSAGKSSEYDFVYDSQRETIYSNGLEINVSDFAKLWDTIHAAEPLRVIHARAQACAALPQRAVPDLCELLVVANSTGMHADTPALHAPILRVHEVPTFFALQAEGGIFNQTGVLDVFHCLRKSDELSFAGGVFVVIRCEHEESWALLKGKGHLLSTDGQRAMVYIPRHLLGLEAATSVLDAVTLGESSGAQKPKPVLDLIARATKSLRAGSTLTMGGHHHLIDGAQAELMRAAPLSDNTPAPFYLIANRQLIRDIAPGQTICYGDVSIEADSVLLTLRRQQDAAFFS